MSKNEETKQIRCSFCGRTESQVERLISGPNAFICNECVMLCVDIIEDAAAHEEYFDALAGFWLVVCVDRLWQR